jgi:hypothetical protein
MIVACHLSLSAAIVLASIPTSAMNRPMCMSSATSMTTLDKPVVSAVGVRIAIGRLYIELSDGREIGVPLERFAFLSHASAQELANWTIEPGGFAVYWPALGDGLEVKHLLDPQPL